MEPIVLSIEMGLHGFFIQAWLFLSLLVFVSSIVSGALGLILWWRYGRGDQ